MILFIYGWVAILALAIVINVFKQGYDERIERLDTIEQETTKALRDASLDSYNQALAIDSAIRQLQDHCKVKDPIQLHVKTTWNNNSWRGK